MSVLLALCVCVLLDFCTCLWSVEVDSLKSDSMVCFGLSSLHRGKGNGTRTGLTTPGRVTNNGTDELYIHFFLIFSDVFASCLGKM